jgi:hypothetical protein
MKGTKVFYTRQTFALSSFGFVFFFMQVKKKRNNPYLKFPNTNGAFKSNVFTSAITA